MLRIRNFFIEALQVCLALCFVSILLPTIRFFAIGVTENYVMDQHSTQHLSCHEKDHLS